MKNKKPAEILSGVFPPMMTPFKEDQSVDFEAIKGNVEKYNETDIGGLMPLGSNGEFAALTDDESIEIVKVVSKAMSSAKILMVGVGRESAYHTVEFAKSVIDVGAQIVSVLTPHYFPQKMDDDSLYAYYTYIADRVSVPVVIYNAPKFSANVCVSPELIARLSVHPNIIGMKDTSSEDIKIYIDAAKEKDFYVMAGSISKLSRALQFGSSGGVLSIANYLPQECCEIFDLWNSGKHDKAKAFIDELVDLTKLCSGKTGIAGSKACMTLMGFKGGVPRLPLIPVNENQISEARQILKDSGHLK